MPMQPQFSTTTLMSTHLWLDNWLTQRGQAYTNHTSRLFYQPDGRLPGYVAYAAPFRSWVCDSGVSGAWVPSQISGDFGVLGHGQSGLMFDFVNGRVLLPAAFGTGHVITGSYAFKDLNVYKANETQEKMVFGNKYYLNPRFSANAATGAPPIEWDTKLQAYNMVTPCVFLNDAATRNEGWAFGGAYETTMTVSLTVMAETMTQLEGALSLITDAKDVSFPQLPFTAWPLDFLGDFKGGTGYNYETLKQQYGTPANLYTITEARTSKVGDGVRIDQSVFLGVADLTVTRVRAIH